MVKRRGSNQRGRTRPPSEALEAVKAVYAEWEARPLERACTRTADCCRFRLTGLTPFLTLGEALLAARAWKASGRRDLPKASDGECPFLGAGSCRIHADRPFACRTHFCEPAGGPAPRAMVRDLIHRLEDIDRDLGGRGAVNLPVAIAAAMERL